MDADRFPGPPDWTRSIDWMTYEERLLQDEVKQAQFDLEAQVAALQERVVDRVAALNEAQTRHDADERVLLTGQGEDLVAAVTDLRVKDPQSPWQALAEIKGCLTSGGTSNTRS